MTLQFNDIQYVCDLVISLLVFSNLRTNLRMIEWTVQFSRHNFLALWVKDNLFTLYGYKTLVVTLYQTK